MKIVEVFSVEEIPSNCFVLMNPVFEIINIDAIVDFIQYDEKRELWGKYEKAFLLRSECKLCLYPSLSQ